MATPYRADQVGSFLRPPAIKQGVVDLKAGKITQEQMTAIEDAEILKLLQMQKEVGIDVFSDGELRRSGWASGFQAAVDGYVEGVPSVVLQARGGVGAQGEGPAPRRVLGAPLVQRKPLTAHEASFLKAHAPGPYKVTMPAASYVASRAYNPEISDKVFGSRAGLLQAVAGIIRNEIAQLVVDGVPYIQLDNPHYTDLVSSDIEEQYHAAGIDPDQALREDVEADNACLEGFDRSNVVLAMHFCRGNTGGGGFHKAGGYDRVAEVTFGGLAVDSLLLEYDSERAGTFDPLRFVPKGKQVVLGLITTKEPAMENPDDVIRRIEEATKYVALEDLSLSPQCGFASTFQGNPLTPEEQRAKLELVVETARRVWK